LKFKKRIGLKIFKYKPKKIIKKNQKFLTANLTFSTQKDFNKTQFQKYLTTVQNYIQNTDNEALK